MVTFQIPFSPAKVSEMSPFMQKRFLPQGSILSPLLFNIYAANCKNFISRNCSILQFADDIAIFSRSDNLTSSLKDLELSANRLSSHLRSRGLEVSPSKSALLIFTRKRLIKNGLFINLEDSRIIPSPSHKFLGVILDSKLSGHEQVKYLVAKCGKLVNILKSLRGIWWGAHPCTMLSIYKALVRGSMEYGSSFLPMNNKDLIEKLEKIQRRSLKYCLGLRQSTPSNVVLAESGVPSLKHIFEFLAFKIIIKSFAFEDNILLDKLYALQLSLINNNRHNIFNNFLLYKAFMSLKKLKDKIAIFRRPPVYCFPYLSLNYIPKVIFTSSKHAEDIKFSPFPQLLFQSLYYDLFTNFQIFFTDTSKTGSSGSVGAAIYSPSLNIVKQYKINSFSSVFIGEALVIFLFYPIDS